MLDVVCSKGGIIGELIENFRSVEFCFLYKCDVNVIGIDVL